MKLRVASYGVVLLLGVTGAQAQINQSVTDLLGQIFLPGGDPPGTQIHYILQSDDGVRSTDDYTDSNGRFIISALNNRKNYSIVIPGDGVNYGDTTYQVPMLTGRRMRISIDLRPPGRKNSAPGSTISANSGYKPNAQAANFYDRAQKEIQKKHTDLAEILLRKSVEADPRYAAASNDLGVLLMQEKKYPEAETYLRQSIGVAPGFINALLNLGITLNHLGRHAEAILPLREALRQEPRLTTAHKQLGFALVETSQFDEAEHELLLVQKVTKEGDVLVDLYLGQLYARTGRFEKSVAAFNSYLEKTPNASNADDVRTAIAKMQRSISTRQ